MKMMGESWACCRDALLAGPAWAQKEPARYGEPDKDKTQTEIAAEKEAERAYQRSLGNIPEQKSTDPWGTVRSDNARRRPPPRRRAEAEGRNRREPSQAKQ